MIKHHQDDGARLSCCNNRSPLTSRSIAIHVTAILLFLLAIQQPRLAASFHTKSIKQSPRTIVMKSLQTNCEASSLSPNAHPCKYCEQRFASRNALFRHVRSNADCTNLFLQEGGEAAFNHLTINAPRRGVAFLIGYYATDTTLHASAEAGKAVKETFLACLGRSCSDVKLSQVTAVDHRHVAMAQEATCVAAGDVVTLRYRSTLDVTDLIQQLNHQLQVRSESTNMQVKVLAMEELSALASQMSAEQDSTQIAYHYLLPMRWLPHGDTATIWWLNEHNLKLSNQQESVLTNDDAPIKWKRIRFGAKIRNDLPHATDPPPSLRLLKDVLKSAASRDTRETKEDMSPEVPTGGRPRFRGLEGKEKRCWHNFADPALRGNASPSNNPVWRTLDRARTIEFFAHRQDAFMVVELRGDGFVTQQVRRIIGSAVAIAHGWLPADFMDIATRPEVFVETPLAPVGNMYMAGARFDFNEVKRTNVLFGDSDGSPQAWMEELRDRLLTRASEQGAETNGTMWLENLRDVVAPRIRAQLQQLASEEALREARRNDGVLEDSVVRPNNNVVDLQHYDHRSEEGIPPIYEETLSLLRGIVQQDKWPATSIARSRVIRAGDSSTERQSGSFTVVNAALLDIADGGGTPPLPLANLLFPDLASAVFALERDLSSIPGSCASARPPSTHCAVNRNAEFTPHVDSGRGAGQSVSMIVGLGNYNGGGLMVEGVAHDIRYTILEFDGWKLRHWTEPFEGERFSLVWFTPEQSGNRKD